MDFGVLGPLTVRRDGVPLELGTPKARVLLAVLLCRPGRPVSGDALADAIWGEERPKSAAKNVQTYVHPELAAYARDLGLGDRAVLPFAYTSTKKGTVAVTVTAIEKGAEADMAAFGAKAKGMTPYFIKMKVENVGGTDLAYASLKLDAVLEGGSGTGIVLIGDIPGTCDSEAAPREFTTKGASYETCVLSASKDKPVTGAEFDEGDAYQDSPVVWAK
ncbi:hypothetical protein [Streptomyces sp. NPDC050255]|uniref:hypothetical protein n=1 Tax=Streptomyces sp. NPDC050255 TaxID=3365606 RepID=UPI00378A980C